MLLMASGQGGGGRSCGGRSEYGDEGRYGRSAYNGDGQMNDPRAAMRPAMARIPVSGTAGAGSTATMAALPPERRREHVGGCPLLG